MGIVQVLLITRITAGSKPGFWRGVLGCAKAHSGCIQMSFPADSQTAWEQAGMGMRWGSFSLCWLRPCLLQFLLFSLCILQHFLQSIGHSCLSLTQVILWTPAAGRSGRWLNLGTLVTPSCTADLWFPWHREVLLLELQLVWKNLCSFKSLVKYSEWSFYYLVPNVSWKRTLRVLLQESGISSTVSLFPSCQLCVWILNLRESLV